MSKLLDIAKDVKRLSEELEAIAGRLAGLANGDAPAWTFPVGSDKFPVADWYCAQYHLYDRETNPRGHTGLDLNGDRSPWGDVDRNEPVFAITDGTVHDVGWSNGWRGIVVIRIEHEGSRLWVRYAHLSRRSILVKPGDDVVAGQELARLGNYTRGDHLHFDAALTPFGARYWKTRSVAWIDPLPILRAHLDDGLVDAMLARA